MIRVSLCTFRRGIVAKGDGTAVQTLSRYLLAVAGLIKLGIGQQKMKKALWKLSTGLLIKQTLEPLTTVSGIYIYA
ncbi:hypothetical protein BK653_08235 [Pseudomonas brassicacearum]|nr:hypothetical protein BK653_08235 [Pseudomonas brassicacearum]